MRQKYYVWGFPGIGKSSVNSNLRIADADCERFKFLVEKHEITLPLTVSA